MATGNRALGGCDAPRRSGAARGYVAVAPERSKASTSEVCLQALGRLVPVG